MQGFSAVPANGTLVVSWASNKEAAVNTSGGGYRIYTGRLAEFDISSAPYTDVKFNGTSTPTTATIEHVYQGQNYVRIAAFAQDSAGLRFSEPSTSTRVNSLEEGTSGPQLVKNSASRSLASVTVAGPGLLTDAQSAPLVQSTPVPRRAPLTAQEMSYDLYSAPHSKKDFLIRFRSGATAQRRALSVQAMGGVKFKTLNYSAPALEPIARVSLPEGADDRALAAALSAARNDPDVEYAQPNFIYHKLAIPNDTLFHSQWDMSNSGQAVSSPGVDLVRAGANPGQAGVDMNMQKAWDIQTDCSSVIVAVVDTGVDYTHEDLVGNIWSSPSYPNGGYDFVKSTNTPKGLDGHGTHVAGVIGAVGNNGKGIAGVCWKAKIMSVRVLDDTGAGFTADVVSGINFAVANGAKVINMSLGITSYDQSLADAITSASQAGVVMAVAAGNSGLDNEANEIYPCNLPDSGIICVAALDQKNALADYSNFGASKVDVGAPGTNIASLWNGAGTVVGVSTSPAHSWMASNWGYVTDADYGVAVLGFPMNWNGVNSYVNNSSEAVYETVSIAAATRVTVDYFARYSFGAGDSSVFAFKAAAANPFAGGGTLSTPLTGSSQNSYNPQSEDVTACAGLASCSFGFRFTSDASGTSTGVTITQMEIKSLQINDTSYNMISGTSMATPHVAGLAALVWSVNPTYSAAEVIHAIVSSGKATPSLSGKTSSGRQIDAQAALRYLQPPSGIH
jgi:thermitase